MARTRTIASTLPLLTLLALLLTLTPAPSAHAAPFSFSAGAGSITIAGAPAPAGASLCAVDTLVGDGAGGIDSDGAACATVAADGAWALAIDTDDFDGSAYVVSATGRASSLPIALANGAVSFDSVSTLELVAAAVDGDRALLLSVNPRETEVTGTVRIVSFVFDAVSGPVADAQVTFSFSGPGSPSNVIPVPTNAEGRGTITVFAGDLGTVEATATLTPTATVVQSYSVVEPPEPDPLPALVPGFNAWLGRDAMASEVIGNGQILWKWTGSNWISLARTSSGFTLGADYPLILGNVLFLGIQG